MQAHDAHQFGHFIKDRLNSFHIVKRNLSVYFKKEFPLNFFRLVLRTTIQEESPPKGLERHEILSDLID